MIPVNFFSTLKPVTSSGSLPAGQVFYYITVGFDGNLGSRGQGFRSYDSPIFGAISPNTYLGDSLDSAWCVLDANAVNTQIRFTLAIHGNHAINYFDIVGVYGRADYTLIGALLTTDPRCTRSYDAGANRTIWTWFESSATGGLFDTIAIGNWNQTGQQVSVSINTVYVDIPLIGKSVNCSAGSLSVSTPADYDRTSNLYWNPEDLASWDGTGWKQGTGQNYIYLDVNSSWATGFRPTSVTVTVTGLTNSWAFGISGSTVDSFGTGLTSSSVVTLPLPLTEDITFFGADFDDVNPSTKITSIIFHT